MNTFWYGPLSSSVTEDFTSVCRDLGVWLGNDDDSPMSGEQGGRTPTLLWMKTMQQAFPTLSEQNVVPEFPQVRIKTCTISGKQAIRFCPEAVYYDYPPYETELPLCNVHDAF